MSATLTKTIWYSNHSDGFVFAGKNCLCSYKGTPTGVITIPSNITCVGMSCFGSKTSQFSVVLNDLITILPQGCFYNSSVVSINLQKINKIGYQCFISCRKLNKIHLINISVIDTHSFYNCLGLQYVKIESSIVPTLNSTNSFEGTTCKFYVLDSLVDSYKIATNWSTYADRILPISQFATDFPNG